MRIVIAITHSNTWFWTQTCIHALKRNLTPAILDTFDVEIVVVDNSWDNSPSIMGLTKTRLGDNVRVINNNQASFCHSAALDLAFMQSRPMTYFIPMDSDCIIRKPNWLDEFFRMLKPSDYAVADWHHEEFLYPSFGLYRGEVVQAMAEASEKYDSEEFRWGDDFDQGCAIPTGHKQMLQGPFSERRGWPNGTRLREKPSGQRKGPGHYEPGQQFHHWAVQQGYTYSICSAFTLKCPTRSIPLGTFYGCDRPAEWEQLVEQCWAVHMWAGTRALDRVNPRAGHPLSDPAILNNMTFWLEREARWWLKEVPADVQEQTLGLIKEHGWWFKPVPHSEDGVEQNNVHYRAAGIPL